MMSGSGSTIHAGKHSARLLTKTRILLKADASEAGEGWNDSQTAAALDTSIDTVARTRQQLVEEGLEAVLIRKHSPASARPRIFDGAAEAKLIALTRSLPVPGRVRWTLVLLEDQVVERGIVARASDNTIGRTLKITVPVGRPVMRPECPLAANPNPAFWRLREPCG